MSRALVVRTGKAPARALAAWSRTSLDAALEREAELWIAEADSSALLVGAFERAPARAEVTIVPRGSGGPSVLVGPRTVHVQLRLAHAGVLLPCEPAKLVNRYVRPLLRALTKLGATAHYFGRDWVSVAHRPAAWVGFAHDATSGRACFEAFVAVETPFAPGGSPSFLGKEPITLAEAMGEEVSVDRVASAIAGAYSDAYDCEPDAKPLPAIEERASAHAVDPTPWRATVDEAMGPIGAGPDREGVFRVGGALLASRDAIASLAARAPGVRANEAQLTDLVRDVFSPPGVAIHGVRSLDTLRDVVWAGLRA